MRTIFYLIDLHDRKVIETYEGQDDKPPKDAIKYAQARAITKGHTHTLARGKFFFQTLRGRG